MNSRSIELQNRSISARVRLNRQLLQNLYWCLPVDDEGHENYMPVGRGVKSSTLCGVHVGYNVCKDVEAHKGIVKNGVDYTDTIGVRHRHLWCKNAGCYICFIRGWSTARARKIEARLSLAVEREYGVVEHIVVSAPQEAYGLSEYVLRKKARAVLASCGIVAGVSIFHGFRVNKERMVLAWGSHYHVLGFVDGGYDRCRECKGGDCYACDGIQGKLYRAYRENGWIVRILDKRETVYGTSWYLLHHSTLRLGVKRFHAITWFGRCAYNNFKTKGLIDCKAEIKCFICGGEMVKCFYTGKLSFAKNVGDADYEPFFAVPVSESDNFIEVVGGMHAEYRDYDNGRGSGSYEA